MKTIIILITGIVLIFVFSIPIIMFHKQFKKVEPVKIEKVLSTKAFVDYINN